MGRLNRVYITRPISENMTKLGLVRYNAIIDDLLIFPNNVVVSRLPSITPKKGATNKRIALQMNQDMFALVYNDVGKAVSFQFNRVLNEIYVTGYYPYPSKSVSAMHELSLFRRDEITSHLDYHKRGVGYNKYYDTDSSKPNLILLCMSFIQYILYLIFGKNIPLELKTFVETRSNIMVRFFGYILLLTFARFYNYLIPHSSYWNNLIVSSCLVLGLEITLIIYKNWKSRKSQSDKSKFNAENNIQGILGSA